MRAGEILDAQADLIERLGNEDMASSIAVLAANHIGKMHTWENPTPEQNQANRAVVEKYREAPVVLRNHTRMADAYRVTHDMSLMVQWISQQIEDTDAFYRELMPSECGIVCFDEPLPVKDIRDKTMLTHWIIWGPGEFKDAETDKPLNGTVFWHLNDTWRRPDEIHELFKADTSATQGPEAWDRYERMMGRWATVGMDIVFDGQRMGPALWQPSEEQRAQVAEDGFEPHPGTNSMRYVQALFLLLGQTVTATTDEEIPRHFRRRAVRKHLKPQITVIRLRRQEYHGEPGESGIEYDHQWLVKRHLRWQPYGQRACTDARGHLYGPVEADQGHLVQYCVHGCGAHLKKIVINAYVKGTPGTPLIISKKIYQLDR